MHEFQLQSAFLDVLTELVAVIPELAKKVAETASIYVVSLAEMDRRKLVEARTGFEAEWKRLRVDAQESR